MSTSQMDQTSYAQYESASKGWCCGGMAKRSSQQKKTRQLQSKMDHMELRPEKRIEKADSAVQTIDEKKDGNTQTLYQTQSQWTQISQDNENKSTQTIRQSMKVSKSVASIAIQQQKVLLTSLSMERLGSCIEIEIELIKRQKEIQQQVVCIEILPKTACSSADFTQQFVTSIRQTNVESNVMRLSIAPSPKVEEFKQQPACASTNGLGSEIIRDLTPSVTVQTNLNNKKDYDDVACVSINSADLETRRSDDRAASFSNMMNGRCQNTQITQNSKSDLKTIVSQHRVKDHKERASMMLAKKIISESMLVPTKSNQKGRNTVVIKQQLSNKLVAMTKRGFNNKASQVEEEDLSLPMDELKASLQNQVDQMTEKVGELENHLKKQRQYHLKKTKQYESEENQKQEYIQSIEQQLQETRAQLEQERPVATPRFDTLVENGQKDVLPSDKSDLENSTMHRRSNASSRIESEMMDKVEDIYLHENQKANEESKQFEEHRAKSKSVSAPVSQEARSLWTSIASMALYPLNVEDDGDEKEKFIIKKKLMPKEMTETSEIRDLLEQAVKEEVKKKRRTIKKKYYRQH